MTNMFYSSCVHSFTLIDLFLTFLQLGLSTPIRQGQTLYQYLVMQFTREEEISATLNMNE